MSNRSLNILSIDGGGVRGLASLLILKHIMESIDRENPPKPCEYFSFIGGTGSGGVIAIMLGRLKMDVDLCIAACRRLLNHVLHRKRYIPFVGTKYDGKKLAFGWKKILVEMGYDEEALLKDEDTSCRVFVNVVDSTSNKIVPLTSYESKRCPTELYKSARIWEAGYASFAAVSLFDPVPIGPSEREFHDNTKVSNNPMRAIWIEAKTIWHSGSLESQLKCFVSIGAGVPSYKRNRNSIGMRRSLSHNDFLDTELEANTFLQEHTELDDDDRLFRFNVPNGLGDIGLDEISEIETIMEATKDYLSKERVYKEMRRCANALSGR